MTGREVAAPSRAARVRTGPAARFARDRAMSRRVSDSDTGTPGSGSSAGNAAEHRAAAHARVSGRVGCDDENEELRRGVRARPRERRVARAHQEHPRMRTPMAARCARPRPEFAKRSPPGSTAIRTVWRSHPSGRPSSRTSRRRCRRPVATPRPLRRRPARRRRRLRRGSSAWVSAVETPPKSSASPTSVCSSCSSRSHFPSHARCGPVRVTAEGFRRRVPSLGDACADMGSSVRARGGHKRRWRQLWTPLSWPVYPT